MQTNSSGDHLVHPLLGDRPHLHGLQATDCVSFHFAASTSRVSRVRKYSSRGHLQHRLTLHLRNAPISDCILDMHTPLASRFNLPPNYGECTFTILSGASNTERTRRTEGTLRQLTKRGRWRTRIIHDQSQPPNFPSLRSYGDRTTHYVEVDRTLSMHELFSLVKEVRMRSNQLRGLLMTRERLMLPHGSNFESRTEYV